MKHCNNAITLQKDKISIYRCNFDHYLDVINGLEDTLSVEEKLYSKRFKFQRDSNKYIIRHGILKTILSQYFACKPVQIDIQKDQFGKPKLSKIIGTRLHFNISSSGNLAVFSFSLNGDVGIDVELMRPLENSNEIARRYFTKNEYKKICLLKGVEKTYYFYKLWTRKEAILKSQGMGLMRSLNEFDVSDISPLSQPIELNKNENSRSELFWVEDIKGVDGYAIAVALKHPIQHISITEI